MPSILDRPLRLAANRVERFYRGGALLEALRGAASPTDGQRPEDWVGSVTRTWTPPGQPATAAGLSRIGGGTLLELLARDPQRLVGHRQPVTGLLVKLLDTAIRLPIHAHPTRAFARRVLGSRFGKAEAWIVLATRQIDGEEPPHIRIGFRDGVSPERLRGWIERQQTAAMLEAMARREVQARDVYFVPPGRPHAIGPGVFMVEVQEPTDFSVVAETDGFPIAPADAHLRRGWDTMLACFELAPLGEDGVDGLRQPIETVERPGLHEERLLGPDAATFFRASRLSVSGEAGFGYGHTFAVLIVVAGGGALRSPSGSLPARAGDTFAIPAAIADQLILVADESMEIIACLPPEELPPG